MKKIIQKYRGVFLLICFVFVFNSLSAQNTTTSKTDSISKKDSVPELIYKFKNNQEGNLFLNRSTLKEVVYDKEINRYIVTEKIGNTEVSTPLFMTNEEYKEYKLKQDISKYYKEKISALNSDKKGSKDAQKDLLPTYYVNSSLFKTIFGGNTIEVNTQGSIDVKLGGLYQKIDNPLLSQDNRTNFTIDFDQQVTASIAAKIGERLKVSANYDTRSTFDFQNLVKLEFLPASNEANSKTEDDIVRKIELGNVSMNPSNNLITGSQSLFGLKTQLQFGKTTVTSVFSQQKSQSKTVTAQGGATLNEFELQTTQYAANQHFFLSHYFRNNFEKALSQFPLVNSPVTILKVEVWVTNRNSTTVDVRNVVALTDLGESGTDVYDLANANITSPDVTETGVNNFNGTNNPSNEANSLGSLLVQGSGIRSIGTVKTTLPASMVQGTDYTILENAKKLTTSEFSFHPQLGILSLNRRLTDGDVLAVAFQYTINGSETIYRVGELSTDGIPTTENIALKLLRSEIIQPNERIWDLMMKNVYALGAYQLQKDGFRLELLYKDDRTGVAVNTLQNSQTNGIGNKPLLNLMRLDVLDQNNFIKPLGDGYFDYVEGITVNSQNGKIMFPTLEPFGRDLEKILDTSDAQFVFNELYTNTQTLARVNYQNKDKYLLKGYYKSDASNGISLGAFNVPQGSVKVTSNGILLTEGTDYVVNYLSGRVQIINPAIEASGAPVQVSLENNTLFNQQVKRYIGIDVEHKFSDKFQMTGTLLNVNEQPLTQKAAFGAEPINNTILGLSLNYDAEAPILTKLVNKLPFQDTDVPSNVSVRADMAYLKPGSPRGIDQGGEATTYVDDFEGSQIPISLMDANSWKVSSKPLNFVEGGANYNFGSENVDVKESGNQRAKLAWYTIDRLFYGGTSLKPDNIDNEELSRAEVSRVEYSELFPETDLDITQTNSIRTFDLAYFPKERGPYNYDATNIDAQGNLANPDDRWAGITRALTTTDFERQNVEYIQFWLQDPFENYSLTDKEGADGAKIEEGELFINLGNISEDILNDTRKVYENGFEAHDNSQLNNPEFFTQFSKIPTKKSLVYAFDNDADRSIQDVGYDGLSDADEKLKFTELANLEDPSSDNFRFYRGTAYDAERASIISRYKHFNNPEGNSTNDPTESFPTSGTTLPDAEDVNNDQTLSNINAYWQYKISLKPQDLKIGENYIVDVKTVARRTPLGTALPVTWYQFRIPVTSGSSVNGIADFNSIRFMRMFLTKFKSPVVLRFGQLQLVRGDWRRYNKNVHEGIQVDADNLDTDDMNNFTAGVVNIEENESRNPIPYVLPPGIVREQLQGSTTIQFQNEQSLAVKLKDLPKDEARGLYKNTITDLRMFKKLRMFIHAEGAEGVNLEDDKLMAVIRLGADLTENYYQIEIPLKSTMFGATSPEEIWPEANNLEVDLRGLGILKAARYAAEGGAATNVLYPAVVPGEAPAYRTRLKGSPNLANIKTIMLGIKNISDTPQSGEIWFNELRASGFDNQGGWATVVNANANFADLADIAVSGRMQTIGFGSVEQRVNERSQEEVKQYGVATNVNIGKLMPKNWGVKIPMSYSVSEEFKDPKFDPQFQDVLFEDAVGINDNSENATDHTKRKSISFINVRKERVGELTRTPKPYDVENFSVSYTYNEQNHKDYNIKKHLVQDVRTSANYAFSMPEKYYEPFKGSSFFKNSKYFKLIQDMNFNFFPSNIAVNSNITRSYNEQLSRNLVPGLPELPTLKQRNFLFDWDYSIGYNPTKSLKLNFRAANRHIFDSFEMDQTLADETTLFTDFFNMGRPNNYNQKLDATYKIPIDKLPFLSFVSADYTYSADFDWQAGSQSFIEQMGNTIQNANTHNVSANLTFNKFYKEIGLDKLFDPKKRKTKKKKEASNEPKFATPRTPRAIGKKKKKSTKEKILKATYDLVTSLKTARFSYSENNGTLLPGYAPEVGFLGRDRTNGGLAPTGGFVFGSQVDIRQLALENNWLITRNINQTGIDDDPYYNREFSNTHYEKFDYNFNLKPITDLDIVVTGNRIETSNMTQIFDPHVDHTLPEPITKLGLGQLSQTGNFSMSYNMFATAFDDGDAIFEQFKTNISIIRGRLTNRLANETGLDPTTLKGYGVENQEVLLPAFAAAYAGKRAENENLNPFRTMPLPNWRVNYRGLMKIGWVKKNFSAFTLSHAYRSSYTIGGFTNNIQYAENLNTGEPLKDVNGNYFSKTLITNLSLMDGFSPLIKVDFRLKNSISFRGEIKTDRNLTMNFNNNTVSDMHGKEYIVGMGYRIKDLRLRSAGRNKREIRGDLNIKADVSLRRNLTTIREIENTNSQITGGQDIFTLKMSADYNLSRSLVASFYYDQTAAKYAISTSFPRTSINTGISIVYNLGN